jgi:F-type H+-transporting ATPase subunit b
MAEASKLIIVAQAEGGDALQEGVVVDEQIVTEEVHDAGLDATLASTEDHGGDHSSVFPPFDPATFGGQLFWLALTFIALYVVMSRIALPRIGGILESRRARIEGDLKEADRLRQETDRAIEAYEAALAEARANAHGIAEQTRNGIKADIEMKRNAVEADLAAKVAAAEASIAQTKSAALGSVDTIAAETLHALMERLTGPVSDKQATEAVAAVTSGAQR